MPDTQPTVFDLSARRNPVAGVIRLGTTEHKVLKFNGEQYRRVGNFNDLTPTFALYDLAQEVVPSAKREEIEDLDKDLIGVILAIAGQGAAAVERALFPKNGESPETPAVSTSLG